METDTYRVLVTGSRDLTDGYLVREQLGHCRTGADAIADMWVTRMKLNGWPVEVERHPAQHHPTESFGPWPACGPIRNSHMVSLGADECLAFVGKCTSDRCQRKTPHGSHGASDCASKAAKTGITVKRWDLWRAS